MSEAKHTAKHSPLPWMHDGVTISDARDREIADTWGNQPSKLAIPDAALIVEAVNNYEQLQADQDALLAALKGVRHRKSYEEPYCFCGCYSDEDHSDACLAARAAISQAEQHKKGGE